MEPVRSRGWAHGDEVQALGELRALRGASAGQDSEMLAAFYAWFRVSLVVSAVPGCGVLVFIIGPPLYQYVTKFLIVAMSFQLRIRRNRAKSEGETSCARSSERGLAPPAGHQSRAGGTALADPRGLTQNQLCYANQELGSHEMGTCSSRHLLAPETPAGSPGTHYRSWEETPKWVPGALHPSAQFQERRRGETAADSPPPPSPLPHCTAGLGHLGPGRQGGSGAPVMPLRMPR
ncbi:hypothetical protein R6Z07F_009333 [Ovis aries]